MPLKLPNLDDRTYEDLVEEARALIPVYAPAWTNHNESDPGITLVELFAFLTEMLIYRANRVTDANYLAFLKLLKGSKWTPFATETLAQQKRAAVKELREENRAVTCADFERLAGAADAQVARARCLPRRNLESENESASSNDKPGHMSVVIVPDSAAVNPAPSAALVQKVKDYLEPRRLLTTQVHVVGPRYFAFGIRLALRLKPDAVAERYLFALDPALQADLDSGAFSTNLRQALVGHGIKLSQQVTVIVEIADTQWLIRDDQTNERYPVRKESAVLNLYEDTARISAIKALKQFLDPLAGGENGKGWPFGRNVFISEIYQLLDTLPGIDYVSKTSDPQSPDEFLDEFTSADASRLLRDHQGDLVAVEIQPDELIGIQQMTFDLTIIST